MATTKRLLPRNILRRQKSSFVLDLIEMLLLTLLPLVFWKSNEGSNGHKEVQQGRNNDSEVSFNEQ